MSYHRGGHPGAVAVSYSASTMAPLSPSRRYSGSNGSSTGGTSSTSGSSTTKYSFRTSASDRPVSYYSSASTNGYRTSSFTFPSDSFRGPYISPARSVSSYNETSSIGGVSSSTVAGSLRYGSASSSSASSTTSSTSSCGSRDRNATVIPTAASLAASTADFYAKYSPTNYVPNIYGTSSNNISSNGHWRPSSTSSGVSSSSALADRSGDDYDSCRDRRDRSYSSEASSGIGISSNSSSNNSNSVVSPSLADRWSTRREAKRRTTPVQGIGSVGTVLTGHAQHQDSSGSASTEVTLNVDSTKIINSRSDISSGGCSNNCRTAATNSAAITTIVPSTFLSSASSAAAAAVTDVRSIIDEKINDRNVPNIENNENNDVNPDIRDIDNNNSRKINNNGNSNNKNKNNNNNDRDLIVERDNNSGLLDQRRRRRRDNDDTILIKSVKNETVVARNNRDYNDDINKCRENCSIIGIGSTSGDSHALNHHHNRSSTIDESRGIITVPVNINGLASTVNASNNVSEVTSSSSAFSLSSALTNFETSDISSASLIAPAIVTESNGEKTGNFVVSSNNLNSEKLLNSSDTLSIATSNDGGGGVGAGGDADHHRIACTRTKLTTNPDNTELLTNNNGQDREASVLGIVDTAGRTVDKIVATTTTRIRDRSNIIGTRKTLLWTATNEIDGAAEINDRKDGAKSTGIGSDVSVVNNPDDTDASKSSVITNGRENATEDNDNTKDSDIYDINRDEPNGITLRINGLTGRPSGTRSDDPAKPSSSSGRTIFGWNDPTIDDLNAPSSSSNAAASSSTTTNNSVPVAVHQNLYRGVNDQIDESSNSRPPRSRLQSRRDERYGLNGLRNIGNTCFMNSVIQCLSNTRPLLEYLLNEQHLHDINTTTSSMKGALIKAFGQVIHELWEMSGDHVVNTTALKSQIQRFAPRFMGYSQQDAQEFLRYLLEGLHEDVNRVTVKPQPILTDIPDHYSDSHKATESWKRYLRSEDSTIVDVFVGQLRSSLQCTSCDHVSVTLDPVWDLSLPIPSRSGTVKLNQCLEHFTKVETMDGDEKPTCSKCQMRRKCTKSFSIQKFPKILVIHLKRFSPTERFRGKLSVLVDFPLTGLDLSAFAAPGVQGCTYNLYGVANHSGTTYSGHYTAYCKHPYSGEWHEYNDNRVSSVPARSVVSSEAYVLFYEQQPLSPHL